MKDNRYSIEKGPFGRDVTEKAKCPFCGLAIERPSELNTHRLGEMPVGSCSCGSVYAYDVSGHNLGSAFSEALVFSCDMDWDLAWNLLPDDDYLESLVENYDDETNLIVPDGFLEGRKIPGALYFIRLHDDIREATEEGVHKKLERARPVKQISKKPARGIVKRSFTKQEVAQLVNEYRLEPLLEFAAIDNRIIRDLQRLIYSGDELLRLRAAETLGHAAAVISRRDSGAVAKLLHRLFTALEDTASSSWGAVDAAGEVIAAVPGIFSGYIPELYKFLGDESLKPRVLRALGRVAETHPKLLPKRPTYFVPFLQDNNPETRGYAAMLLGLLNARETRDDLEKLREDTGELQIYVAGQLVRKTVGEIVEEASEQNK
ncbi:MAG TPA: PBS lyase [Desulfotomaculum sp.]|nr:MAG: PBS lyase [Peptococcaceae bacterium BRH_c8a]KJS71799.1 MAG: PBS lyase [Desulfotomaculum sp. BICA1-6]HBX23009.1 PBS lyase [Desulfotomaculum sp.]